MKFENFILTSNEIRLNTYTKFKKGNDGRWFFKQNLSRDLEIETNNPLSNGYGYFLKKW